MSSETHVILSCFLSMGLPVLWGCWELWSLRRWRGGGGGPSIEAPAAPKPLPDCLIPRPLVRPRELEDA
jgi:hypothetical protein